MTAELDFHLEPWRSVFPREMVNKIIEMGKKNQYMGTLILVALPSPPAAPSDPREQQLVVWRNEAAQVESGFRSPVCVAPARTAAQGSDLSHLLPILVFLSSESKPVALRAKIDRNPVGMKLRLQRLNAKGEWEDEALVDSDPGS